MNQGTTGRYGLVVPRFQRISRPHVATIETAVYYGVTVTCGLVASKVNVSF